MHLSGNIFDYAIAFWSGVLVSFTPCVYPLMPVTAGIIAGLNTQGSRWRGFVISLVYVLGLAVTYSCLAVVASLSGKVFGQLQNDPVVFLVIGNILVLFALCLFDVIQLPALGIDLQGKIKLKNLWTVFFLGMAGGFIVGPCTAPVLGSLLLYVAAKKNVLYGASLLFVFSYGVGASLILIGTFSGFVSRLPRSGVWLVAIKRLCAVVLLIAGELLLIKAGRLMQ
jgi:cytochrome c-type biogenesis protein